MSHEETFRSHKEKKVLSPPHPHPWLNKFAHVVLNMPQGFSNCLPQMPGFRDALPAREAQLNSTAGSLGGLQRPLLWLSNKAAYDIRV
jgi:hypothetical protein